MKRSKATATRIAVLDRIRTTVRGYMLRGVLVLVPLSVTAYVLMLCYRLTAGHLVPFVQKYTAAMPHYAVVVFSVVLFLALLYLIGLATAVVVGRRLVALGEAVLRRIPVVKTVYAASKQVVDVLSLQKDGPSYQAAVLIGFPSPHIKALAFVTGRLHIEGEGDFFRVFVPTTPNPTSGYFEILPAEFVQQTNLSVEDAAKAYMSAGTLTPPLIQVMPAVAEAPLLTNDAPGVDGHGATAEVRQAFQPAQNWQAGKPASLLPEQPAAGRARTVEAGRDAGGPSPVWEQIKRFLRARILSGFLALVPLGITVFIVSTMYGLTAGRIAPLAQLLTGPLPNYVNVSVSIMLLLVLLYVTGYVATAMLGARLIRLGERIISRIPLVTTVYGATKQIIEAVFQQDGGPKFQAPVVVEFPYPGARTIGFAVGTIQSSDGKEYHKVFIPTVPNITVGLLQLYEADQVRACGLTIEEAVKMAVSCGLIGPSSMKLSPVSPGDAGSLRGRNGRNGPHME